MEYEIIYSKTSLKFIKRQDKINRARIIEAISELKMNPLKQRNVKELEGYENIYRKRVGDFRIVFNLNDNKLIVYIVQVGNRGDIYKKF